MFCVICYHLYNFKRVNIHGAVLHLVKLQALACKFTIANIPPWMFFTHKQMLQTNGTKSPKASHIFKIAHQEILKYNLNIRSTQLTAPLHKNIQHNLNSCSKFYEPISS